MSKAKRNTLLLLALATVLVALLAMSLQNTTLAPGEPFALEERATSIGASGVSDSRVLEWLTRGFVALTIILLPVYIIYSLMSKQGRRRLIANLIMLAIFLLIANQLQQRMQDAQNETDQQGVIEQQPLNGEAAPLPAEFPSEPPAWLTVVVILAGTALLLALVGLALYIYRQRHKPKVDVQYEALAEAAQQTIETIQSGGDLKASVIACYREMSRVVQQQRGIERETTMTPREFEDVLIRRGLPGDAVRTLTRLFESVRYGSAADGAQETEQAISCLTEIADYCQSFGGTAAHAGR